MHNLPQRKSFVVLILLPRAEALGLQLPERPDCPFQTTGSFGFKGRFEERKGKKKRKQRETEKQRKKSRALGALGWFLHASQCLRGCAGWVQAEQAGEGPVQPEQNRGWPSIFLFHTKSIVYKRASVACALITGSSQ